MERRFEGQLAVITASTAGIGFAIAKRLGREGATVIVSSRSESNVDSAVAQLKQEGITTKGIVCHVGDFRAIQNLIQEAAAFGGGTIDMVVSNAAISPSLSPLSETKERAIDATLKTNVKAAILLVQAAVPFLSKEGRIVFNASISAFHDFSPGMEMLGMYAVSKTALLGVTKAFSNELAPKGIRVNCVAPGVAPTKLSTAIVSNKAFSNVFLRSVPLGRFAKVEEIAAVVAFLLSKDAAYITGETIVVGGGAHSRL